MFAPLFICHEPEKEYREKSKEFLSSHLLADFRKCPALFFKKRQGLVPDEDRPAYALGRATHTLILEGRDKFKQQYAFGGPINPKTNAYYGANTKAYAEWAAAQGKPVLTDDQVALIRDLASAVRAHEGATELLREGTAEAVVRHEYCGVPCQVRMDCFNPESLVAFQICWKLWNSRWNRTGEHRRPRILYLADRNILVDDPKDKTFTPFGDARWKIEGGVINKGREMYFAIYQAIARDENRPGLYREYSPDFFDFIVVDECHRGSAKDDSCWREILEYFEPAYQLGLTATPKRDDNVDTYRYFGNPIYTYSLRQGIEDGFLAPYRVHRIVTTWDAAGWRPSQGDLDRYGRNIPDDEYHTRDFERIVALKARTQAIARHLTDFLKATDRFAKTIVFCVDQEHADEMRQALNNLNADLVARFPDYVCRVTADEGGVGRGHLSRFQDVETQTPVILTTSQLLTTGVDIPTCKNVALSATCRWAKTHAVCAVAAHHDCSPDSATPSLA
ncbi:MAG TPA: DEAD/DEAH box helicase family protein [Planctomycetota bacterium]|jgi:hypothetical protein